MKLNKAATLAMVSWLVIAGFLMLLVAMAPRASAGSITVTNPNSSSVWNKGSTYTITWAWTIDVGPNVKIEYDYSFYSTPIVIAASTPNDGSYSWTVPSGISSRTDYFIRIWDLGNLTVYDDSEQFEIAGTSGLGEITVTNPDVLDSWNTGSTYSITWTTTGSVGPNVKIEYECLICGSDGVVVASTPTSAGSYSWAVPTSLAGNQYYQIRVSDASNPNVFGDSNPFYVRIGANAIDTMLVLLAVLIIIIIVVVIVAIAITASRRKAAAAPPPQANIPVAPPPIQYGSPPSYPPQTYAPQQTYVQAPMAPQPPMAQQPPEAGVMKVCRNCGRSIPADFTFCIHCGGRT